MLTPNAAPASAISKLFNLPNAVNEDSVTVGFILTPVNVPAAAGTVIFAVPSNATPLIFLGVKNLSAEYALPAKVSPMTVLARMVSNVLVLPVGEITTPRNVSA